MGSEPQRFTSPAGMRQTAPVLVLACLAILALVGRSNPSIPVADSEKQALVSFKNATEALDRNEEAGVTDLTDPMSIMKQQRSVGRMTFADYVKDFPWEDKENHWDDLFYRLFEANVLEPPVPINATCRPPSLSEVTCEENMVFTGRERKVKVGHGIILGFDVDSLEIHLNELYDVIDIFFILEWTAMHNGNFGGTKRLTWDAIKHQQRFVKFKDKVVHFLLDDLDSSQLGKVGQWTRENYQEEQRWAKIEEWNNKTQFFGENDLIGLGDADEIASRENVYRLRSCEWKPEVRSVDIGIWFPFGYLKQAFRTDWPVPGHPYTLGDPTYWTFKSAREASNRGIMPSRQRGRSGKYLLGGVHLTHYGYLPFALLKIMSCTECSLEPEIKQALEKAAQTGSWADCEREVGKTPSVFRKRLVPVEQARVLAYFPWYYACNQDRYPTWMNQPDPRTE